MFKKAIQTLRDADPERLAIYEQKLGELTWAYVEIGWRKFRTGPCGVEVEAKIGSKSVNVPISEEEALALAAGRAFIYMRSVTGAPSACRVEIRLCPAGRQDMHERKRKSEPVPETNTSEQERARKIVVLDARLAKLAALTTKLQAQRDALCAVQSSAA